MSNLFCWPGVHILIFIKRGRRIMKISNCFNMQATVMLEENLVANGNWHNKQFHRKLIENSPSDILLSILLLMYCNHLFLQTLNVIKSNYFIFIRISNNRTWLEVYIDLNIRIFSDRNCLLDIVEIYSIMKFIFKCILFIYVASLVCFCVLIIK